MPSSLAGTDQILKKAVELHQKQQIDEATKLYDAILQRDRNHFDALQLLGLCHFQTGQHASALKLLNKALSIRTNVASVFNHRGIVLRAMGRGGESLRDFDTAISIIPDFADAYYNKGNALRDFGRLREAQENTERALQLRPDNFQFRNNLAGILRELGLLAESLQHYNELLRRFPRAADGHLNRAIVLFQLDRFEESISSCEQAINLKPQYAEALSQRGSALIALRRYEEALESCDKALGYSPEYADAHTNRATALRELSILDEAIVTYETAIRINPESADSWLGLGQLYSQSGDFAQAEGKYLKALSFKSKAVASLLGLADVKKFSKGDPLIREYEERLSDSSFTDRDRAQLHYAFAKICNDLKRWDDAFYHFSTGKGFMKSSFDLAVHKLRYSKLKNLFTRQFFLDRQDFGIPDERPVFVVGMPRSGTTLTEQILASHPSVEGLGELEALPNIAKKLGGFGNIDQFISSIAKLQVFEVHEMATQYLEAFNRSQKGSVRLVDKRPYNYEWLGLIALMFPHSHIIHCRRDAMDNCVSMYMQNFHEAHGYNRDLVSLGGYYREYSSLMDHWSNVLPMPIHECIYENTVSDFESSTRSLVEFLGLDWDSNCLEFHQQNRQVKTLSLWQVRQPLYGSSVGRWRQYEKHLGPLKTALEAADETIR